MWHIFNRSRHLGCMYTNTRTFFLESPLKLCSPLVKNLLPSAWNCQIGNLTREPALVLDVGVFLLAKANGIITLSTHWPHLPWAILNILIYLELISSTYSPRWIRSRQPVASGRSMACQLSICPLCSWICLIDFPCHERGTHIFP